MKLMMLKGLPASGKSTKARELAADGWVRVNKDDLRQMLHGGKHTKGNEKQVLTIRDNIINDALQRGRNVVVDDTNLNPIHEDALREIAKLHEKVDFVVDDSFLQVPIEECIKHDLQRRHSVGERVIRDMYNQYLKPPIPVRQWDTSLAGAVICDIDGTLAHMVDRSPFDWAAVGNDEIDQAVSWLLRDISGHTIILLSGRDEVCRPETEEWLKKHEVMYDELYMRPKDDMRKDSIVKRELFDKYIDGKYNVLFMLDDRDQVVNMWRNDLGLKVFQVAEGNF